MKRLLLFITLLYMVVNVKAQTRDMATTVKTTGSPINQNTIVKDSVGKILPFNVWTKMAVEKGYTLQPVRSGADSGGYILVKMSPEQTENYKRVIKSQGPTSANVITRNVNRTINEKTIVKDSTGNVLQMSAWKEKVMGGDYRLRAENPADENTSFVLVKVSDSEKQMALERALKTKPAESKYFTTGATIAPFEVRDIAGKKITPADWVGKTVVINYWFVACIPCRREMPELNKLAEKYKDNPNVLFIGIALDGRSEIKDFLKTTPFNYRQVADGREYAQLFGINSYPTNLVINKEGKVQFHASGYSVGVPHWIEQAVAESEAGK